jgi:hypothetical protein
MQADASAAKPQPPPLPITPNSAASPPEDDLCGSDFCRDDPATAQGHMNWLILITAGLFEIVWAIGLKYTEGFSRFLAQR